MFNDTSFENLVSQLSANFINLPFDQVDEKIDKSLELMVHSLGIERSLLHLFSDDGENLFLSNYYVKPGIKEPTSKITSEDQPYLTRTILNGKIIAIERIDELPQTAKLEIKYLKQQGVKSALAVPLTVNNESIGVLTFTTVNYELSWPDYLIKRCRLVGEIFGNILDRKKQEQMINQAFKTIEGQLKFEELLSSISSEFIALDPEKIDQKINEGLKKISDYLDMDRIALLQFSEGGKKLTLTHRYAVDLKQLPAQFVVSDHLPWFSGSLSRGQTLKISSSDDFPKTASAEKQYIKEQGIKSFATIPMKVANMPIGAISFSNMKIERTWPDQIIRQLRVISDIFANAVERKNKEQKILTAYSEIEQLKNQLEKENIYLKEKIELEHGHDEIFGKSPAINYVLRQAEQVAKTDSSVLIQGETGTGKELLARSIHNLSSRKKRTMVVVNCGAIPASLIENEIFGREKGAYTGAISKKAGSFEIADGSNLFLDEIGELPLELQTKLLMVIEEGEIQRLGSNQIIKINVRVIAASNRDLKKAVSNGSFRMDLYYRLNVFPIIMPPLRERREDIPILIWEFVRKFEKSMGKRITTIKKTQMEKLQQYDWPGNVRELRNVVELAMIVTENKVLNLKSPETMMPGKHQGVDLETVERNHIIEILQKTGWRVKGKSGAAKILGLHPATLFSKMKKLEINRANSNEISSNG